MRVVIALDLGRDRVSATTTDTGPLTMSVSGEHPKSTADGQTDASDPILT
jgi:hypothetical protein